MKKSQPNRMAAASFLIMAAGLNANAQTVVASGFVGNPLATQGSSLPTLISTPVAARSNPFNALGFADNFDNGSAPIGFYALGFGGTITLEMSGPICNYNGSEADFTVYETSYGSPSCASYPEKARVEVSQDACKWVDLGIICQNASLDLGCLSWAKYVRVTDVSNPNSFGSGADGFDLDGIEGIGGCAEPTETGLSRYAANGAFATQGLTENGGTITPFRSNSTRMVGLPMDPTNFFANDGSTSPSNNNFFSLGNGGSVVLTFPYTLFNGEGADVKVFETSFGDKASRSCGNYPEKATVEGSCDGETWFDLVILPGDVGSGEVAGTKVICRDGMLDFNGHDAVNYIRITDVTFANNLNFPGVGDGFDVDAVVGTQGCAGSTINGRIAESFDDGSDIMEDVLSIETYPNPTDGILNVSINRATTDNMVINIADITGRIVMTQNIYSQETSFNETLNLSSLTAGIYTITFESADSREIQKLIIK